jgi:hypothetical protein
MSTDKAVLSKRRAIESLSRRERAWPKNRETLHSAKEKFEIGQILLRKSESVSTNGNERNRRNLGNFEIGQILHFKSEIRNLKSDIGID